MKISQECSEYKILTGDLRRRKYQARIEIAFKASEFKSSTPLVFCNEEWIRKELDWHCYQAPEKNGIFAEKHRLCWIHPLEWHLAHNHLLKPLSAVIEEGTRWIENNITKLVDRHWFGHENDLKKWRQEWGGWGHGDAGTKQLMSEYKKLGHPSNWEVNENI